ncbi:MAG: superoxide dismutase [Akkermansia sp.]
MAPLSGNTDDTSDKSDKSDKTSRRHFMAVSTLALVSTLTSALSTQASQNQTKKPQIQPTTPTPDPIIMNTPSSIGYADGKYILPPLPYAYDALEPLMDEATVRLHHDKHHAAYVAGANAAADKLREIADGKLDASQTTPNTRNLAFHTSGHALHTLFWTNMSPTPKKAPEGALAKTINDKFGSLDAFIKVFKATAAGVEGSGWAILALDPSSGTLVITGVEKHQNNQIQGAIPLLACDVWEHAYYLKHQNNRAAFIDNFIQLINWQDVENRYTVALKA